MSFQKNLLIACLSTTLLYSASSTAHAGFEWVPSKQKAPVQQVPTNVTIMENAPVAPVVNETLQTAPTENQIIVAPAPVTVDPAEEAMMPLPGEVIPQQQMQTMTITAPADQPATIQPQELKSTETEIDIPALNTADAPSTEPVMLVPQQQSQNAVYVTDETPIVSTPVTTGNKLTIQPFPIMKGGNKDAFNDPMVQIATKQATPEAEPTNNLAEADRTDAVGFGNDMPLALAVQQIVPPGYAYSFAQSVNAGQRVSWSGGKAWDLVLKETLEPIGMDIRINGKSVMVVQDMDQMSYNATPLNVQSIEPAAGTEMETVETQISPAAAITHNSESTTFQSRNKVSDPGEAPSTQPDLSALDMPEAGGVQIEMDITESEAAPSTDAQIWSAKKGDSLKTVLHDWAKQSNTQIIWEASYDYRLDKDIAFEGSIENAYRELFATCMSSPSKPNLRFVNQNKDSDDMALIIVQDAEEAQPIAG